MRRKTLIVALGLAALLTLVPGVAWADDFEPQIQGVQACVLDATGTHVEYVLYYTATSWNSDDLDERVNRMVSIRITDAATQDIIYDKHNAGAFLPTNNFQFSGVVALGPQARTVILSAKAEVPWGPNPQDPEEDDPGDAVSVTVPPANNCPATSTTAAPTTTTVAPTTTTAATTTTHQQSGTTTTELDPTTTANHGSGNGNGSGTGSGTATATGQQTGGSGNQLPFTGATTLPVLLAGLGLLAGGFVALRSARRRAARQADES